MGRFICADSYESTGQGLLGANMFAYCGNNPVKRIDPSGHCYYDCNGNWRHDNWEYIGGYVREPAPAIMIGTTRTGENVYVSNTDNYSVSPNSIKVIDMRTTSKRNGVANPNMQVVNSYKIHNSVTWADVSNMLYDFNAQNPVSTNWIRTPQSMLYEWWIHNLTYDLFKIDNCISVDFDNNDEGKGVIGFVWERYVLPKISKIF